MNAEIEPKPHSRLGIASAVIGFIAAPMFGFFALMLLAALLSGAERVKPNPAFVAVCSLVVAAGALSLVGLGFGIVGITQSTRRRDFAIVGTLLNAFVAVIFLFGWLLS